MLFVPLPEAEADPPFTSSLLITAFLVDVLGEYRHEQSAQLLRHGIYLCPLHNMTTTTILMV